MSSDRTQLKWSITRARPMRRVILTLIHTDLNFHQTSWSMRRKATIPEIVETRQVVTFFHFFSDSYFPARKHRIRDVWHICISTVKLFTHPRIFAPKIHVLSPESRGYFDLAGPFSSTSTHQRILYLCPATKTREFYVLLATEFELFSKHSPRVRFHKSNKIIRGRRWFWQRLRLRRMTNLPESKLSKSHIPKTKWQPSRHVILRTSSEQIINNVDEKNIETMSRIIILVKFTLRKKYTRKVEIYKRHFL